LPVAQVVSIVARVADALDYAHRQNVVHRDIKPANIMFDAAADAVKVSDFGIARITDSSKTRTGLVLGTPSFMAPEQLAGNKVDGRCDLYALGVTLFQLLTGSLPLRGDSMSALMHNIAHQTAPDVRTLRPELSDGLAHIVATALRKDPRERYQTGRQFAADLRNVENTHPQAVATAPEPQSLVYDARSNHQEHNMAAFQETVMDIPAARAPVSASEPGAQ
jgi:serine/threonine-protein kinase